jgi:tyrosyl-tRNA synthetase
VTALVHGGEAADNAARVSEAVFDGARAGDAATLDVIAGGDMPSITVPRAELGDAASLVDLLVRAGLALSKADARRGIQGGGYYVNGEQITDVNRQIAAEDFGARDFVLLRKGKKNYVKLVREQ